MEKVSVDGHIGEDTHLYCAIPHRMDGETRGQFLMFVCVSTLTWLIAFCFTLEVFSQSGSLGVEHWAKYKPHPSDLHFPGGLGKFDHEFTFIVDQIRLLFTDLVG